MKMETELRAVEEMRAELAHVRMDIQQLDAARQELLGQIQGYTQDLARSAVELQQVAAVKAETQELRHETQHLRSSLLILHVLFLFETYRLYLFITS
jgi:chromosome segregation ATPase